MIATVVRRSIATLCACLALVAVAAEEEDTAIKVSYLTGSTVYVDAGRDDGLKEGDTLELVRDGKVVAVLQVTFLSSGRAACSIRESSGELRVGDVVRRAAPEETTAAATAVPPPVPPEAASPPSTPSTSWARSVGIRGRIGVRYLSVSDNGATGSEYSQPSLDLKVDGIRVGGSPVDFALDVRSRRTSQSFGDGTTEDDATDRVYRAAVAWNVNDAGLRLSAGRQFSPSLATLSIFDGVAGEMNRPRWSAGALTGTQPDPLTYGYSTQIREHGAYFQVHNLPQETRFWSFTTGVIGSYDEGEINREFLYLQGQYVGRRISAYLAQEIDYNRGWKSEIEESTIDLTSTFGNVRIQAGERLYFSGGYDNRRNVRLFRDQVTPETEFDDSYREGVWVGASSRFGSHFGVGVDARTSRGGDSGTTDSYGLRLQFDGITSRALGFRTRSTRYTGDFVEGWLHSLSVGVTPTPRFHVEATAGVRDESQTVATGFEERLTWVGLDADIALGRRFYLLLSGEKDDGDLTSTTQYYVALSYRF